MSAEQTGDVDKWESFLEMPWGALVFLALTIGDLIWTILVEGPEAKDYLVAVSSGAGLLAVGHGSAPPMADTDARRVQLRESVEGCRLTALTAIRGERLRLGI
jgi:hypothetical protein